MGRVIPFRPAGKGSPGQTVEAKQKNAIIRTFLDETSERLFHRWLTRGQAIRHLALEHGARVAEVERAIRRETARRLFGDRAQERAA